MKHKGQQGYSPSRKENEGVDDIGKSLDVEVLNTNNPGRSTSTGLAALNGTEQARVAGAADDADAQNTDNVETDKAVEDELGDAGDGAAGVLDLTSGEGDHVGAGNGEGGVDDDLPESQEPSCRPIGEVGVDVVAVAPVAESVGIVHGVAAGHGDEGDEA